RGIGYDPSQPTQPAVPTGEGGSVEIVGSAFDDTAPSAVDMVCSQHVLEHMPRPVETLQRAREHLVAGGLGYFEVPNGETLFRDLNIWDLNYEHVSYFSTASLCRVLLEAGFAVRRVDPAFGHQYLDVEAVAEPRDAGAPLAETFNAFPALFAHTIAFWRKRLSEWRRTRQKVVLWGAGAKAVSFLNMLGVHANEGIDFVVDVNPRKAGHYIPGTGQRIVVPGFLRRYQPDWIVVMNPEYQDEVGAQLRSLNVGGAVVPSVPATAHLA
ncbi:MAG: methyltransferase domain-containing protein, partial [Ktedonobacteraceae bacterium]